MINALDKYLAFPYRMEVVPDTSEESPYEAGGAFKARGYQYESILSVSDFFSRGHENE